MFAKLQSLVEHYGREPTYWVAYSGGLDSQVLLDLCVELRQRFSFNLRALHVHHGLSSQADAWEAHCARYCKQAAVDFFCHRIDARPPKGESLEAFAREGRYRALKANLKPGDLLLTAHHQDDQAETVLLQFLRGAGPKGLSAMPVAKAFGPGLQLRPLLTFTRAELQSYAEKAKLSWVEDELNQDRSYPRNFIRHELLPFMKTYWPEASKTLARSAEHCAEAQALLNDFAKADLEALRGPKANTISIKPLLELPPARQRLILRTWFEELGAPLPNTAKLFEIQNTVLKAAPDRNPRVLFASVELRRYQSTLYLLPLIKPQLKGQIYHWDLKQPLVLPSLGTLSAIPTLGQGLVPDLGVLELRFRQGGEQYRQAKKHHSLKNFFQEQGIPPWERERLPLLFLKGELIAIPGHLLVESFKVSALEEGLLPVVI